MTRSLSFELAPGETRYIRSWLSNGVLVGRMKFELMDAAEQALQDLSFTGTLPDGSTPRASASQRAARKSAGDPSGPPGGAGGWWAPGQSQRTQ